MAFSLALPSPAPDATTPGLLRPPKAEARSVESLVADARGGVIRVPGWQRKIRWAPTDACQLLDSVFRGYPVGTLLFWKRSAPAEEIALGTVRIRAEARSDALYVVDGQQRLTSLVRALAGSGWPDESFALYFDTHARKILSSPKAGPDPRWLPLTEVVDSRRLLMWLLKNRDADQDAAIDFGARVREYSLPVYIVDRADEDAVREIFARINNTGKQLDAHEVFDGRFRGRSTAPAGLRDVKLALEALGIGALEETVLHTMMMAQRFTDLSKADTRSWGPTESESALGELQMAGERVLAFLAADARIPTVDLLPYTQPLLTLSRFFHFHPSPHPRNRQLLSRWLWRGASAGLHGGSTIGSRAELKAVTLGDEHGSVQALLRLVAQGETAEWTFGRPPDDRFRGNDARAKIATLALVELAPRHLVSGERLDRTDLHTLQIDSNGAGKSSLGNRVVHPALKGGLRDAIVACEADEILASHDILPEERALLRRDPLAFSTQRGLRLADRVAAFVERLTDWGANDRPPIAALVESDEDTDSDDGRET